MKIIESFTNRIGTTALNNYFKKEYVDSNTPRLYVTTHYPHNLITNFATGIMLTLLHNPDIRFLIRTKVITTTYYAMNNLNPNGTFEDLKNKLGGPFGYNSEEEYIFKKLTGTATSNFSNGSSDRHTICVIEAPKGMTNVQRWMSHYGYNSIETNIADKDLGQKILLYKLKNTLIFITNPMINISDSLTKLTGWLPLIFKEIYKDFLIKDTPVYDFFTKCYNNEAINYDMLKHLEIILKLKKEIKTTQVATAIDALNNTLKETDKRKLNELYTQLKNIEMSYTDLLQKINLAEMCVATNKLLENKELLIKTLSNNPHLDELWVYPASIVLRIKSPVDYDKTKFKNVHKSNSLFNKIMTADFLELYWTSTCELNHKDFTIRKDTERQGTVYTPNTHWYNYNCFGNNTAPIAKALKEKDFLSAFMLTLTAAQLLNIYDMTVVHRLAENLEYGHPDRPTFLNKETGCFISYAEAKQLIKEKEKENAK